MSITLEKRLGFLITMCKKASEALKSGNSKEVAWCIAGIQAVVESTLCTPRPDIRQCIDEPEPQGLWHFGDEPGG